MAVLASWLLETQRNQRIHTYRAAGRNRCQMEKLPALPAGLREELSVHRVQILRVEIRGHPLVRRPEKPPSRSRSLRRRRRRIRLRILRGLRRRRKTIQKVEV